MAAGARSVRKGKSFRFISSNAFLLIWIKFGMMVEQCSLILLKPLLDDNFIIKGLDDNFIIKGNK